MSERYESYMKFARAVARVRGFIVRNRILLITIGALAVTTAGAYVGTKGIIMEDAATVAAIEGFKFEYGQPIEASVGGFLSSAEYQFSPVDEENWTSAVPENVGQYKMRAVSQSSFGERYGDTHYFEIKPKKATVSIVSKTVKFEEDPRFIADGLLNGHVLAETKWSYDDLFTLTPNLVVNSVTIHNAAGADVTANYDVAFPAGEDAKMTIEPRLITVSLTEQTLLYNGTEQTFAGKYTITDGTLAKGDVLVQDPVKATHAGKYSHGGFTVQDVEGKDRSMFYDIKTTNPQAYAISKKSVTVTSASASKTYDGKGFSVEDRGTLAAVDEAGEKAPDTFTYEFKGDLSDRYAPGNYENAYEYELANKDDYEVTAKTGTLSIAKRDLRVLIAAEWTYNGNTFAADAFDNAGFLKDSYYNLTHDTSLADGDVLRIKCNGEVYGEKTFVGQILHGDTDVTATCYNLDITGAIATYQAELTVAGKETTLVYDGKPHGLECEISGAKGNDEVTIDSDFKNASITDIGSIEATPSVIAIRDAVNEDRSMYYAVTTSKATTTITKRPLQIEVKPHYVYTGDTIDFTLNEAQYDFINETSLAEGHRIEITADPDAFFPMPGFDPAENAFTTHVYDGEGNDVTANYEIALTDSSSKALHQLKLSDAASEKTFVYDGTTHTLAFKREGELDSDDYSYSFEALSITEPGSVSSTPKLSWASNKTTSEDTTRYYGVETEEVKITVTKRPVEITCRPSRTYEGSAAAMVNANGTQTLLSSEYSITAGDGVGLIGSDYVEVQTKKNIFSLSGEEKPGYSCHFYHYDGTSADNCYEASFVDNGYEAEKDPTSFDFYFLSTLTNEKTMTYDGTYDTPYVSWNDDKGLGGYAVAPVNTFSSWKADVGTYEVAVPAENFAIYDSYSAKANEYYSLSNAGEKITATLTIEKRPIEFTVKGRDGSPEVDITDGSLVSGHSYSWTYSDNGGSYVYSFKIVDAYNVDVTANYDPTVVYDSFGDVDLTLSAVDCSFTYQGIEHYGTVNIAGLRSGDTIQYQKDHAPSDFHWMYAGSGTYEPKVSKILDASGKDVTSTYNITTAAATWTINPAEISITLSGSRYYQGELFSKTPLQAGSEYTYSVYLPSGEDPRFVTITNALFNDDRLTITPKDETIFVEDVDPEYNIEITGYKDDKWVDFSSNYSLAPADFDPSGFSFYKADVYINGWEETFQYDGQDHKPATPTQSGLWGSDTLGGVTYDPANPTVNNINDANNGRIDYTITEATIKNGTEDRTKYYNVHYTGGYIEIDAHITLDLGTYHGVHTGEEQSIDEFLDRTMVGEISPTLPSGWSLKKTDLRFNGSVHELGYTEFTLANLDLSSVHIYDKNGNDVSDNFIIDGVYGGVYLETGVVTVSAVGQTKTYDGSDFKVNVSYTISLNSGESITWGAKSYTATVTYLGYSSMAGDYDLEINGTNYEIHFYGEAHGGDAKATDADLIDIDPSLFTILAGSITPAQVNPRSLTIETDSIKEYTNFEVDFGQMRITGGSLATGDYIDAVKPGNFAFNAPVTCNNGPDVGWSYVIRNKNGEDVTSCYDVTENWGSVVITELEDW